MAMLLHNTRFVVVNVSDFNTLRATFGRSCGESGYDARAGFRRDQVVDMDIGAFNLLKGNFGKAGAPPVAPQVTGQND